MRSSKNLIYIKLPKKSFSQDIHRNGIMMTKNQAFP